MCGQLRDGKPVLQADLARTGTARWPAFTQGALDAGIRAIFALPLQVGGIRLGVLDLYRDTPGSLTETDLGDALSYADAAAAILLHLQTEASTDVLRWHVTDPMDHYAEVRQATGKTAELLDIPLAHGVAADNRNG